MAGTGGAPSSRGARPGPSVAPHQPQQEGDRRSGSDGLQAEAVQAESARMGYLPAAVSFVKGRLQVRCLCHATCVLLLPMRLLQLVSGLYYSVVCTAGAQPNMSQHTQFSSAPTAVATLLRVMNMQQ